MVDCEFDASPPGGSDGSGGRGISGDGGGATVTHAMRIAGNSVAPVLTGCRAHSATGAGVMLDNGASALLLQCEISGNRQGGILLGEGASVSLEHCGVSENGHFGMVIGQHASRVYLGRTNFSLNTAGSIWHCGVGLDSVKAGETISHVIGLPLVPVLASPPPVPLWLDQCSLMGAGEMSKGASVPAVVIGPGVHAVMWESLFGQLLGKEAVLRVESSARIMFAGEGPGVEWFRSRGHNGSITDDSNALLKPVIGGGDALWIDISGAVPLPEQAASRQVPWLPPAAAAWPGRTHQEPLPKGPHWPLPEVHGLPQVPPLTGPQHQPPQTHGPPHEAAPTSEGVVPLGDDKVLEGGAQAPPVESALPLAAGALHVPSAGPPPETGSMPPDAAAGVPGAAEAAAAGAMARTMSSEGGHLAWMGSHMGVGELPASEQNRHTLFELLSMLASQLHCHDILDTVGLGGPLKPGDRVFLRGHTGRWVGTRNAEAVCNRPDRGSAAMLVIETKTTMIRHDSRVAFKIVGQSPDTPGPEQQWLGVTKTFEVRLFNSGNVSRDAVETLFTVQADRAGHIMSGTPVYLRSVGAGRTVDIEGEAVRARTQDRGTLQRIVIEKAPTGSEVPSACPSYELKAHEKVWLLRRGVQHALVDKQQLAKLLSGHRPHCRELLREYAKLWEAEWRQGWSSILCASEAAEDSTGSPASRGGQSSDSGRAAQRRRAKQTRKRDLFLTNFFSNMTKEDQNNGNLFVSALRSFFATELRLSQLEHDPVQRVIEAFAEALVSDESFLEYFSQSMLPEKERKAYRKPEDVLFGLTYTTVMLNTDMHNKQVAQKMWDTRKFIGAGKDCGVTGGLMLQIFKNIQKEEL